jgi:hypothetical protein
MKERLYAFILWVIALAFGAAYLILPSVGATVFLSPDETAVAAAARSVVSTGSFAIQDPLLASVTWMHPRSFVTAGDRMVPVGFLGMPALMSVVFRLFHDNGLVFFTPLFVLLTAIPLWSLAKGWGRPAQFTVVIAWLSFPTVMLYANRGLFPNLPLVCLTVWATWLLVRFRHPSAFVVSGLLIGLASSIRPTETPWMLLWIVLAFVTMLRPMDLKTRWMRVVAWGVPFLVVTLFVAWIGRETYGAWFTSGYQLRDPILESQSAAPTPTPSKSLFDSWPFGFHPRNVWFNVKSYLIVYLFPWFAVSVAALVLLWRDGKRWIVLAALATAAFLALVYGQGLYQDHVRLNQISLANSFLRYTLPLAPLVALGLGFLVSKIARFKIQGRVLAGLLVACLVVFSVWTATQRDDEGLFTNRAELVRYAVIRSQTKELLDSDAVILSERSDKIFFPVFRTVSPLPPKDRIVTLFHQQNLPVALFLRTVTSEQLAEWRASGIDLIPLLEAGNETLYRALPL